MIPVILCKTRGINELMFPISSHSYLLSYFPWDASLAAANDDYFLILLLITFRLYRWKFGEVLRKQKLKRTFLNCFFVQIEVFSRGKGQNLIPKKPEPSIPLIFGDLSAPDPWIHPWIIPPCRHLSEPFQQSVFSAQVVSSSVSSRSSNRATGFLFQLIDVSPPSSEE